MHTFSDNDVVHTFSDNDVLCILLVIMNDVLCILLVIMMCFAYF